MPRLKTTVLLAISAILLTIATSALSEVVILKDGSKYIGKITEDGDKIKIATEDGEIIVKKDRIKTIYKDVQTIDKELTDLLTEAQKLTAGANKIEDRKERNAALDKAIEMLMKAQNICMDVIDVFTGKDAETIANKFKEINGTLKHARSLKVMDKDTAPPAPTKEPPKDTNKPKEGKPKSRESDIEAQEAAREFYGLGLASFKAKQYDKARELFIKSIAYNKDFPEVYAKLGDICTALKEEEAGYGYYQQCVEIINELQSPSEEIIKLRDDTLRKIEKFRLLEEKITALNKELLLKLLDLGNQCINEEDYILSEEILFLARQLDKNNEEAAGLLKKAKEEINKGLKDKPVSENSELANLYYQSALELLKGNKYEEAIEKFNKAMSYRAEFPEALFNLGECYKKLNDNKKALNNYRLCARCLKQRFMSKDDEKLLSQTSQALDKIDPNGKKFTAIKTGYTASSSALANDCAGRKYNSFAWRILQYLLLVDPANKNAQELSVKVGVGRITPFREEKSQAKDTRDAAKPRTEQSPAEKGVSQNLFNGKDINNWDIKDQYPLEAQVWGDEKYQNWLVKDGKIEGNTHVAGSEAILLWKGEVPAQYTLTVKFSIERNRSSKTDPVSFIYGGDKDDYDVISLSSTIGVSSIHKFELIRENDRYKAILNGKVIKDNLTSGSPAIGLMVQNGHVLFNSITLQEMK